MTDAKAHMAMAVALAGLLLTSCSDTNQKRFEDTSGPEWSYDQPFYVRPADGPAAVTRFDRPADPIYVAKRSLAIPRPAVSDSRQTPRTSIWISPDTGMTWEKLGYFGLQQAYYHLPVAEDGTYWVRFIGPGIPPAECKPPKPHMTFVVDTEPPEVLVFVTPNKEGPYHAGEEITIEWVATDPHLQADSVRIGVCLDSNAAELNWAALGKTHARTGHLQMVIPDEAIDKIVTLRITATDRSGNLRSGYSSPIATVYEPPTTQPTTLPATSGAEVIDTPQGPRVLTTMETPYPSLEKGK